MKLPHKILMPSRSTPARIALLYAAFAMLWIVLSGYLLAITVADPLLQSRIELTKGLTFVAVTSGLLYLLLKGSHESGTTPHPTRDIAKPRTPLLLLTLILLVLVVPLMDITIYELRVPEREHDALNNLAAIADLKGRQIEQWLAERKGDAQGLADNTGFAMQLERFESSPDNSRDVIGELNSMHSNHSFDSVMLYAADGRTLSSLGSDTDMPPENLMRQALSEQKIIFSDLYRNPSDNTHLHMDWIVPIITTGHLGKHAAGLVVLRGMPGKFLFPLIQTWPEQSDSGETLLVRSDGKDVLFLNQLRFDKHAALTQRGTLTDPDLSAAIAIRDNKPGTTMGLDYRQVPVLAAYRPVTGTGWQLIAKLDRGEVMQPLRTQIYWISGVGTTAVFIIMVMLIMLLRQQQRFQQLALQDQSTEILKESELRFRTLVGTIPDLVWLKDMEGVYLNCNRQFERLYGAGETDIIGKTDYDFVDKELADFFREQDRKVMASGKFMIDEEWLTFAEGGYRGLFETIKTPVKDADGNLIGVLGVARDISERKRAEESLLKLSKAVEQSPSSIVITDLNAHIEYANAAFERESGYSLEEATGKNPKLLHSGKTPKSTYEDMWAHLKRGETWKGEFINRRKDGSEYFESAIISPVIQPDGRMTHYLAVKENITERKKAEARIHRLTQLYAALSQCNEAIVRCASEEELFPKICQNAVQFGGMKMAWIGMVDETGTRVLPVACYGTGTEYLEGIQISVDADDPFGRGPTGTAIRENRAYWCQDYEQDPNLAPWREQGMQFGVKSSAALPLLKNGNSVGSLTLYSDTTNAYDEEARKLLTEMATDISFALDNFDKESQRKQAHQEIIFKNTILQTQLETSLDAILVVDESGQIISYNQKFIGLWRLPPHLVSTGLDATVLQAVAEQAENSKAFVDRIKYLYDHHDEMSREEIRLKDGRIIDRYSASIMREDGNYYGRVWYFRDISDRRRAERDLADSEQRFRSLVEQSLAGIFIIQEGRLVYVNPRFTEILGQGPADKLIGHPLLQFIVEADQGKFAEDIRQIVDKVERSVASEFVVKHKDGNMITVGANSSFAIYRGEPSIIGLIQDISEKKRDETRILNSLAQFRTTFLSTVQLATSLSEMSDPHTAGHERRVSEIAVAIATELGLDEQRVEGIKVAGYLHDIGKISIPAEILVKSGKLSETERAVVQGHAQAGYDVLKLVEFPWPVATIALQHHERMDGSGYPNGLKSNEILLESRILAVADAVEAMASHPPYRAEPVIDKALAEIERGSGTAYDPDVAAACLRLFREQGYVLPEY